MSQVVNVHVANLRKGCPCCGNNYNSLKEWNENLKHIYVGRYTRGIDGSSNTEYIKSSILLG